MAAQSKGVGAQAMPTTVALFFLLVINTQLSEGLVYDVGDAAGWTSGLDKWWGQVNAFRVGDVLVFRYQPGMHSVASVSIDGFNSCQHGQFDPIFWTGNDQFTLTEPTGYYFISTVGNDCVNGVKLAVLVRS